MPQPTLHEVHIDRWLTDVAIKFMQDPSVYVHDRVFPVVRVAKQSDLIRKYKRAAWFRDSAQPRAPGSQSQGGGWHLTHDRYDAEQWAWHEDIPDEHRTNADDGLDLDEDATEWVQNVLRIRMDRLWALRYFIAGIWAFQQQGVAAAPGAGQFRQWDDYVNSTPITDITRMKLAQWMRTSYQPNKLTLNKCGWYVLKHHPTIIARYVFTQAVAELTQAQVASVFGLEDIIVSEGVYTPTPEGVSPVQMFPILGPHALLSYTPPRASQRRPSAGYTFEWTAGNKGPGIVMRRIRFVHGEDKDRIEGRFYRDCRVLETDLATFYLNIYGVAWCPASASYDETCPATMQ